MNEFTKEELEGLNSILLQSREDYVAMHVDPDCTALLNKIQSLIDNYCEQQIVNTIQSDNDTLGSLGVFHSSDQ